jgi:hypothetical protein
MDAGNPYLIRVIRGIRCFQEACQENKMLRLCSAEENNRQAFTSNPLKLHAAL